MEGEDLEGLNLDDLQQLENMLDEGLSRVIQTKVYIRSILFNLNRKSLVDASFF